MVSEVLGPDRSLGKMAKIQKSRHTGAESWVRKQGPQAMPRLSHPQESSPGRCVGRSGLGSESCRNENRREFGAGGDQETYSISLKEKQYYHSWLKVSPPSWGGALAKWMTRPNWSGRSLPRPEIEMCAGQIHTGEKTISSSPWT